MTENNPVKILMDEHELISSVCKHIKNIDTFWTKDEERYKEMVDNLIIFFSEYNDQFHHQKEEAVLFKELKDNPEFLLDEIIDELEEHHEMFRDTVCEIEESVTNGEFEKTQKLLTSYINDLLDHIAVENDELFILAENLFSKDELERMYFLFQDIDMELGMDRKQELAHSINELSDE